VIVHAIRLKNVKSYGEGPDGAGVTVTFQRGVNRIAGPNGHGKTTLIECLGYALFLTEPVFEENFRVETYLLRHGCKAGEIAVTFSHDGASYRVERGLGGQNKLRAKVVETSDGSVCAEGDGEVAGFLCQVLGLPDAARLREMFSKLIGVKQGRLAWPFDSKPSEARRFFEPLLEVEVFRECFDRLKPVRDTFEAARDGLQLTAARVDERIRERADSPDELARAQAAEAELTARLAAATGARDAAAAARAACEAQEKAFEAARAARQQAEAAASAATGKRADAEARAAEAERAATTVAEAGAAHAAFQAAEEALRRLGERRRERDGLTAARAAAQAELEARRARARALREQVAALGAQQAAKEGERAAAQADVARLRSELDAGRAAFAEAQAAARAAGQDHADVRSWVQGLPAQRARLERAAQAIARTQVALAAWDPARLEAARVAAESAAEALQRAEAQHTAAVAQRDNLAGQLRQLGSGLCPFLGETCPKFDPAKVRADLAALAAVIADLGAAVAARRAEESAARTAQGELIKAEGQLAAARVQQERAIDAFREEAALLVPELVTAAVDRLRRWDGAVGRAPGWSPGAGGRMTADAVGAVAESLAQLVADVHAWWRETSPVVQAHLERDAAASAERAARESTLVARAAQLATLAGEVRALAASAAATAAEAAACEEAAATCEERCRRHDAALQGYAGLDADIAAHTAACDANRPGHVRYLEARSLAAELEARRAQLGGAREQEAAALAALSARETALAQARDAFDPRRLAAARAEYELRLGEAKTAEADLGHARQQRAREEQRVAEWRAACRERAGLEEAIGREEAAIALTDLARRTLQNAAPAVAQHLCDRIASRAQAVFNRINPDPVELSWEAKQYSLRIAPGDRRFAMLSGGEQTKLALAMTLAMVEELSRLRFCIFDEPTYGVDADSRRKLADAILAAQHAAGLEQLLLVSHDDAFDGKIENAITLRKSAAQGTTVVGS
jgi:exonuclease SbcC